MLVIYPMARKQNLWACGVEDVVFAFKDERKGSRGIYCSEL